MKLLMLKECVGDRQTSFFLNINTINAFGLEGNNLIIRVEGKRLKVEEVGAEKCEEFIKWVLKPNKCSSTESGLENTFDMSQFKTTA